MKRISIYYLNFFLFFIPFYKAQPTSDNPFAAPCDNPKIEWIEEISSESINSSGSDLFNSLVDLILGYDDLRILKPFNLVVDSEGTLFFVDQDSKKLIKYSFDENEIESLLDDDVELKSPVGLCLTNTDLVITDSELNTIYNYNFDSDETSILNSSLEQPTGIIYLEKIKEFWVSETKQHRIVRLNKEGKIIGFIGQRGIEQGQFNFPTFIWADKKGNIYINDSMNFRVQVFSEQAQFIKQFGKSGDGSGDFARLKGIATDSFNNIYIVDALFNNVQVFDQLGRLLYSFGEQGTDPGKFWLPTGIFIDSENKIFIADSFNSRIQIYQLRCEN